MVDLMVDRKTKTPKFRRQQLKTEIDYLKTFLPITNEEKENLSQLQTLHFACIYLRKHFGFKNIQKRLSNYDETFFNSQMELSESLFGFLIVLSNDGHLLYVSENVINYIGLKSLEVLLSCDKFTDILHPGDEEKVNSVLFSEEKCENKIYEFLCSWYAAKIKRKIQVTADSKVIKVSGRFIANNSLFVAVCTPMLRTLNRDYMVASSPMCFTSVHSLDMKFQELCSSGQNLLGYDVTSIQGRSLYDLISANDLELIKKRHKNVLNTKTQKGKIDAIKILNSKGYYENCLINVYYSANSFIVCKFQLLSQTDMIEYNKYMETIMYANNDENNLQETTFGYESEISPLAQYSNEQCDYEYTKSPGSEASYSIKRSYDSDYSFEFDHNNCSGDCDEDDDDNVSVAKHQKLISVCENNISQELNYFARNPVQCFESELESIGLFESLSSLINQDEQNIKSYMNSPKESIYSTNIEMGKSYVATESFNNNIGNYFQNDSFSSITPEINSYDEDLNDLMSIIGADLNDGENYYDSITSFEQNFIFQT